jgi:hypothetical protein
MDVFVANARLVSDLARFLRANDYTVETIGPRTIRTIAHGAPQKCHARLELSLYLLVWRALHRDEDARGLP